MLIEKGFDTAIHVKMAHIGLTDVSAVSPTDVIELKEKTYNMFLASLVTRGAVRVRTFTGVL